MSLLRARPVHSSATLSAVIIRADGTREELGIIGADYDGRFKRFWWQHVSRRLSERRIAKVNKAAARNKG